MYVYKLISCFSFQALVVPETKRNVYRGQLINGSRPPSEMIQIISWIKIFLVFL
jgi:hypothetical protein